MVRMVRILRNDISLYYNNHLLWTFVPDTYVRTLRLERRSTEYANISYEDDNNAMPPVWLPYCIVLASIFVTSLFRI